MIHVWIIINFYMKMLCKVHNDKWIFVQYASGVSLSYIILR